MKQVLIITSRSEKTAAWQERERYVREFCEALTTMLEGVVVAYTTYRDLLYTIVDGNATIYDTLTHRDLKEYDLVHFKNWQYEVEEAPVIASYLANNQVLFFNSEVRMPLAPGKLSQMFLLAENNVPVPDTLYTSNEQLCSYFEQDVLPMNFAYPLIMKANDGSRGDDNHFITNAEEAVGILSAGDPEKRYLLQSFIPNDGDYRFLYIGLDGGEPLVFHRKAISGSHLNNTSKGGTGTIVDLGRIPADQLRFARKAAELLGREIGGVDIIVDKETRKPYVLEVNGTPALATGYGLDIKIELFARFLQQSLEGREEE